MNSNYLSKPETVSELIVDAYGCEADLSDQKVLLEAAEQAVKSVGATIADRICYPFQPHGLTLCLILKESHLVLSTWPEHKLAIVNIFLCNSKMDAKKCYEVLSKVLKPESATFHTVNHLISPSHKNKKKQAA